MAQGNPHRGHPDGLRPSEQSCDSEVWRHDRTSNGCQQGGKWPGTFLEGIPGSQYCVNICGPKRSLVPTVSHCGVLSASVRSFVPRLGSRLVFIYFKSFYLFLECWLF